MYRGTYTYLLQSVKVSYSILLFYDRFEILLKEVQICTAAHEPIPPKYQFNNQPYCFYDKVDIIMKEFDSFEYILWPVYTDQSHPLR